MSNKEQTTRKAHYETTERLFLAVTTKTPNPNKLPVHPKKQNNKKFDIIVEYRRK